VAALTSGRVEAFSDGVIAIAATLLVLELHVPGAGTDIWAAIGHQLPSLAAYVVSFGTILIFWVNHHALFGSVARVDRTLLFLNGLLLLAISFISFPTAVLGGALEHGAYARSAAALYGAALGFAALCFSALWFYLHRHPELLADQAKASTGGAVRRALLGPALYGASALVALLNAPAALAVDAVVALYFTLPPRHLRR
jgi:uncharacterized membrane protein